MASRKAAAQLAEFDRRTCQNLDRKDRDQAVVVAAVACRVDERRLEAEVARIDDIFEDEKWHWAVVVVAEVEAALDS